jgi:ATP-binding cassette subfamily F protein 3
LGNYDDYVEKKRELAAIEAERTAEAAAAKAGGGVAGAAAPGAANREAVSDGDASNGAKPKDYEAEKQQKREERGRQRKIEQLEQAISALEDETAALEAALLDPGVYNDYVAVQKVNDDLESKKSELERLYAEWEELSS